MSDIPDFVYRPELSLSEVSRIAILCQYELEDRLGATDLYTDYDREQNDKAISQLKSIIEKLDNVLASEGGAEK